MDYSFREEKEAKATIVDIKGEIDTVNRDLFSEIFNQLFDQEKFNIILNFDQVDYINSTGLGMIAGSVRKARENRGDIKIINVSEEIFQVFEIVKFTKIIEISSKG